MQQIRKRLSFPLMCKPISNSSLSMIFITILLNIFGNFEDAVASDNWGYGIANGPGTWGQKYSSCNGKAQSPINIITTNATIDNDLPIFDRFLFYDVPTIMTISNNGHSITVSLTGGNIIPSSSKLLPFQAQVAQFHFHWGSDISKGSEHQLDGQRFFGELHIVCYNTNYANLETAKTEKDGLAVFAIFIKKGYPQRNYALQYLLDISKRYAATKGRAIENVLPLFSIESILPPDLSTYYRYNGSLTTPTCDETVIWTVFQDPIMISDKQADVMTGQFYSSFERLNQLVGNFRPIQDINKRIVTRPRPLVQQQQPSKFMSCHSSLFVEISAVIVIIYLNMS